MLADTTSHVQAAAYLQPASARACVAVARECRGEVQRAAHQVADWARPQPRLQAPPTRAQPHHRASLRAHRRARYRGGGASGPEDDRHRPRRLARAAAGAGAACARGAHSIEASMSIISVTSKVLPMIDLFCFN